MAAASTRFTGGYPRDIFLDSTEVELCAHCHLVLRSPHQIPGCGHLLCQLCISSLLEHEERVACPGCQRETPNEITHITAEHHIDYACIRRMRNHRVRCQHHREGCTWKGKFRQYEAHIGECGFEVVVCECGTKFQRNGLKLHQDTDCQHPQNARRCRYDCRSEGGDDVVLSEDHDETHVVEHIRFLFEDVREFGGETREKVRDLNERIRQVEIQQQPRTSGTSNNASASSGIPASSENRGFVDEVRRNTQVLEERAKASHNMFTVLYKEIQQVAGGLVGSERKLQVSIQETDTLLQEMREAVTNLPTSMNGTLFWIIEGIEGKFRESESADKASIRSQPFYTSRTGYKLCVRLYMHGDGIGRGQFVSLFLVVMKSKHDHFLRWPFHRHVTFTLMDQSGRNQHVKDSFVTDPASSSFRRPLTEMNIASGCPRFMRLADLREKWQDYVNDDSVIIKVEVNTEGLDNFGGQAI